MANKMTKKEILTEIANLDVIKANKTYTEFIAHELELLAKKSLATSRANIEKQTFYAEVKIRMLEEMEVGKRYRVTELINLLNVFREMDNVNTSMVTYLVTSLVKENKLEKTVEKGASYYSLV